MNDTIYLDESVAHLGHSTRVEFECGHGHISIGKTASAAEPFRKVITYSAFGISVVDTVDIDEFRTMTTDKEKEQFLIRKIMSSLTPDKFVALLFRVERDGVEHGKRLAQGEIRSALGIHY